MCKQAYLIVVFANEIQGTNVSNVKRVIQHVYKSPAMCHSFIAEYTLNYKKKRAHASVSRLSDWGIRLTQVVVKSRRVKILQTTDSISLVKLHSMLLFRD